MSNRASHRGIHTHGASGAITPQNVHFNLAAMINHNSSDYLDDERILLRLLEIKSNCDLAQSNLNNLVKFDKLDANVILGKKEDVTLWRFLLSQLDYYETQVSV